MWINQLTDKKTPPFSDVDSIYTEVADIVSHDTSHDGKEITFTDAPDKGQLISSCLFDVLNFPKKQCKNLTNFCKVVKSTK